MNPQYGIPGGPQSQFIHFNNEINTIVTKNHFLLIDKYILIKIEIINEYQINRIYKDQETLSVVCEFFVIFMDNCFLNSSKG
jgi:hypothetical protein